MTVKLIDNVGVSTDVDDRYTPTGFVNLRGRATWLKNGQLVQARLTPTEARSVAKFLLIIADNLDGIK